MSRPARCERNRAERSEDVSSFRPAYRPCGKPATWSMQGDGRDWDACDECCRAAMLEADTLEKVAL